MKPILISALLLQAPLSPVLAATESTFVGGTLAVLIIANVLFGGLAVFGLVVLVSVLVNRQREKSRSKTTAAGRSARPHRVGPLETAGK